MVRTLIVVAALAVLVACGGQTVAEDPPSSSAPVGSASASATASVLPPVMPALAKEHTEAGAKAFVEYYWEVVNFAQSTLDTKLLRALANPACAGCNGGVGAIEKIKNDGGVIAGGDVVPLVLKVQAETTATAKLMSLHVRLDVHRMTVTYPSPTPGTSFQASTPTDFFIISERQTGWWVEAIEVVK